jgi:hypothetical protein
MLCRQFFTAQHANLAPVLEKLGGGLAQSCTLEKFTVAAAVVSTHPGPAVGALRSSVLSLNG